MKSDMPQALVGKTITAVWIADDRKAIRLDVEGRGSVVAHCDADCCSSTWIESASDLDALIGSPVLEVVYLELPPTSEDDDGTLKLYGLRISTVKGSCVIDFRNESNGYYGGWLVWPSEHFYGGVYEQNVSTEQWLPLSA